jgi:hypothetical protein
MRRRSLHSPALPFVFALAALLPAVASAAPAAAAPSNAQTVAAAKASPLFKREHKRRGLSKAGLAKLALGKGMQMDFLAYVTQTGLDRQPELKPLFDPKLRPELLDGAPKYVETIYELEDRLVVERKLVVPLAKGACDKPAPTPAFAKLCFAKNPANKPSKAVKADLAKLRAKLAAADGATVVKDGVTAKDALALSDDQLLDVLLNSDDRTIHHVSVVPRQPIAPGGKLPIGDFATKLEPVVSDSGLVSPPADPIGPGGKGVDIFGTAHDYPTKYFLTGFTYGRTIDDFWEYTIADSTWLTDRYYIKVSWHLSFGFGVRAPFSVAVKSNGTSTSQTVQLSVAPVDVDANGNPAYPAVGLPANQTFGGKEFVLELTASCGLYVSIPGPNFDKKCPLLGKSFSRDIDPVIGDGVSNIKDWWIEGKDTGLALDFAVAGASIDIGVGADVKNGKIGVRATPLGQATFSGMSAGSLTFTSTAARQWKVNRPVGASGAGLRLDTPRYGFDLALTPKLRAKIDVDVAIYENSWIIGPYPLDFLSISQSFQLARHAGTVEKHDFMVFANSGPEVVKDEPTQPAPPPKPKQPTLPKAPEPGGKQLPP